MTERARFVKPAAALRAAGLIIAPVLLVHFLDDVCGHAHSLSRGANPTRRDRLVVKVGNKPLLSIEWGERTRTFAQQMTIDGTATLAPAATSASPTAPAGTNTPTESMQARTGRFVAQADEKQKRAARSVFSFTFDAPPFYASPKS